MNANAYSNDCQGKKCYPTYRSASAALRVSRHSHNPLRTRAIRAYRCDECSCWHITSQKRSGLQDHVRK